MPTRTSLSPRLLIILFITAAVLLGLLWLIWPSRISKTAPPPVQSGSPSAVAIGPDVSPTQVYAHNVLLRKGPTFRVYIRWIRGNMVATRSGITPSLDDPRSFVFAIEKGVIHANLGDIGNYLNAAVPASFPLKKMNFTGEGEQVRLTGTLHKMMMPLPVEILGNVSSTSDGRIHLHVTRINVLKVPVKLLLRTFHVEIDDIMGSTPLDGLQISGNDLYFDTPKLLPPPYIRGQLTSVTVARPDLVLIYGNSRNDESQLSQWHNFLKLTGGTVDMAKVTMHDTDMTLIDASDKPWFDLDLVNYKAQLVHGFSRMTPELGIEIFMPGVDQQKTEKSDQNITLDWLRNKNLTLPAAIPVK